MEVKKIVEGMTAPQVAQVIDENFNALNGEKATVEAVADVQKNVNRSDDNTGILSYPVFDDTEPVAVGDVRRYEGLLYRAKEAGAHDWDPEKWERVTLKQLEDEKLSELGSEVFNGELKETSIEYTSTYSIKAIGFTIPKGFKIHLSGDIEKVTGRTNIGDDEYQTILDGTIADRDISYIRNQDVIGVLNIGCSADGLLGLYQKLLVIDGKRNNIFIGGVKSERFIKAGLFDFVFDAYFDAEPIEGYWYGFTTIDKTNRTLRVVGQNIEDASNQIVIGIFSESKQFGGYSLMTRENDDVSYILVNWDLYNTDDILKNAYRGEGIELNPSLFRQKKIYDIRQKLSQNSELIDSVQGSVNGFNTSASIEFTLTYQLLPLPLTIPKGAIISLSDNFASITARTNNGDTSYQKVSNGTVADRDINYVRNDGTIGTLVISAHIDGLTQKNKEVTAEVFGTDELEQSVSFTSSFQQRQLPTTIPKGHIIYLSEDVSVTARTNSGDTSYQKVSNGTVADRDINYVKSGEYTIDVVITSKKIGITERISKLENETTTKDEYYLIKEASGVAYRSSSRYGLRPIKILGVGNSWTLNSTKYLGELLDNLGIKIEINTSYAGGTSLDSYWTAIKNNAVIFSQHTWTKSVGWEESALKTFKEIVLADDWDIITHQQKSGYGGSYDSFQPYLHDIITWEKELLKVMPMFFLNGTWSYPNGADIELFESLYSSDTDVMYNAILGAYNQAMKDEGIVNIMPAAPMIQQTRKLGISDIDNPSGDHLSPNGMFAVSCVWAESILRHYLDKSVADGKSVADCSFKPSGLSEDDAARIRALAVEIVANINTYFPNQKK